MTDLSQYSDEQLMGMLQSHGAAAASAPDLPWYENYSNAAIKAPIKALTGTLQLANDIGEALPGGSQEQGDASRAASKQYLQNVERAYPTQPGFSSWLGDTIGDPRNAVMGLAKGPMQAAALIGGTNGLTNADENDEGLGQRAIQGSFGATTGAITGKIMGALLGKSENTLQPEQQRLAKALMNSGVDLTPLQQTGNPAYKAMEGTFKSLPLTSGIQEKVSDNQMKQFTSAILDKAGVNSEAATPDIITKGYHNAGGMIGQITEKYSMPIDNQFTQDVLNVQNEYGKIIAPGERPQFEEIVNNLTDPKISHLPGNIYQDTRSGLGKIAQSAWKRDPNFAAAIDGLQEAMDNSISRVMPADDVAALNQYRGYYGNMKTVMRSMNTGHPDALAGDITPSRLGAALRTGNEVRYTQGLGSLNDLSRGGEAILKEPVKAAKPSWKIPEMIGAAIGSGGAAHGGELAAGLVPGVAGGAASILGPAALQQVYNKLPGYMVNGIPVLNTQMALKLGALLATKSEEMPQ